MFNSFAWLWTPSRNTQSVTIKNKTKKLKVLPNNNIYWKQIILQYTLTNTLLINSVKKYDMKFLGSILQHMSNIQELSRVINNNYCCWPPNSPDVRSWSVKRKWALSTEVELLSKAKNILTDRDDLIRSWLPVSWKVHPTVGSVRSWEKVTNFHEHRRLCCSKMLYASFSKSSD